MITEMHSTSSLAVCATWRARLQRQDEAARGCLELRTEKFRATKGSRSNAGKVSVPRSERC